MRLIAGKKVVSLISIGGIHYVCKKKDDADHSRDGFDACLMNTVELNLAVNGYTDCYVASAQTEPGMGQDYTLYGMDGSRIRTYKTINKKDYNSPWSSFRTVRTSK